jgi:hypothetical protein
MTNDLTINDDGWTDAAAEAHERVLRGTLLRFADWTWSRGREATPVEKGTCLIATGVAAAWVKWAGGKPVEYRMKPSGQPMAAREALGDNDTAAWESPDGKPRDPWQNTRFVYLVDPNTAEAFTFSTSSWGGREAVINLGDAIERVRRAGHPGALPVVELQALPWPTRYGRKSKPLFKIVDWRVNGGGVWDAPQLASPEEVYEP